MIVSLRPAWETLQKHASNVKDSEMLKIQLIDTAHSQLEQSPRFFTKKKYSRGQTLQYKLNLKILTTSRLPVFPKDLGQWIKKFELHRKIKFKILIGL